MIDPKLIEQIVDAWNDDQNHPQRGRIARQLYPVEILRQFVEAAFFASLAQEEGRPLRFSAVLVSEKDATDPELHYRTKLQKLEPTVPFTASVIPKIATAIDPNLSAFAVAPIGDNQELQIWGVFIFSPSANFYDNIPIGTIDEGSFRHDFLTVSTTSPGSLLFSRGNSALGRLANGYFVPSTPTPFTQASLGQHLMKLFQVNDPTTESGWHYWTYILGALEVLLPEAAHRGHGGTIAIVDAEYEIPHGLYIPKYILKGEQRLQATIHTALSYSQELVGDVAYRRVALESLQRIAQLAAVDGALILDNKFNVVAFGATLTAPRWTGNTVVGPDGFGRLRDEHFEVARYGTRHRSGLDFAAAYNKSVVFVISQDGPIRAFVRVDDSTVMCWLDCTTSMFV